MPASPFEMALPDADFPSVVLASPTKEEQKKIWTATHPSWGSFLPLDDYIGRETFIQNVPLTKDGAFESWILTIADMPPGARPILTSMDTVRRRGLFSSGHGDVENVASISISSVYTFPEYRRRGYAKRAMLLMAEKCSQTHASDANTVNGTGNQGPTPGAVAFSTLHSNIGKTFYAELGWDVYPSVSFRFPALAALHSVDTSLVAIKPLINIDIPELCALDQTLLRAQLAKSTHPTFAIPPDLDSMQWHWYREDFTTHRLHQRIPHHRGAMALLPNQSRMWALWARYYFESGPVLFILRFAVEDPSTSVADLITGLQAILHSAIREAADWGVSCVEMWNPDALTKFLIAQSGLQYEEIEREIDSIASLQGHGRFKTVGRVEWVGNEKYAWY